MCVCVCVCVCARRLKELSTYNMERTITILGTIDNYKKAESLISSKLRASYESDMAQFIPVRQGGGEGRWRRERRGQTNCILIASFLYFPLPPTPTKRVFKIGGIHFVL